MSIFEKYYSKPMGYKTVAIILASLTIILACQEAVAEIKPQQPAPWELSRQTLVSITGESHYSPDEFADALGSPSFLSLVESLKPKATPLIKTFFKTKVHSHLLDLDARFAKENGLGKRNWEIQSYTFTYRSQTVDGREIEMSGRVTFLNNKDGKPHQVKTISLHTHQAFLFPEWAPSQSLMFMPLKALWDSAVIEPDLQKWGINLGIESDGGGSAIHMARQLADCTVAALEIMQQHGVTLEHKGYTTNWGSSQGAVPSLMFAKWYDTQAPQWFKDTLRLKSTFCGEGALDMPEFMEFNYHHPELIDPDFIVLVAYFKAFTPEQLGGYKPEEFVPQWYLDTKIQVNGRDYNLLETTSYFTPIETGPFSKKMASFDQVYSPDMLTKDGEVDLNAPKTRAWLSCLKEYNNLEGWNPAHKVYIAHCPKDDMIPYEVAHNLYKTIKSSNVHMMSVPFPSIIPDGGMNPHLVVSFMVQVYMALVENPADLYQIFKPTR